MRYSFAAAALVAGASANYAMSNGTAPSYTTEVVTAYTTYCPAATQISHNGVTYTITEATTLTITNCPCTVTKPVVTVPVTYCTSCPASTTPVAETTPVETHPVASSTPVYVVSSSEVASSTPVEVIYTSTPVETVPVATVSSSVVVVVPSNTPVAPGIPSVPVYNNATVPVATGTAPAGTGAVTTSTTPATFTGAANKMAASGASLAGLLGLAALIL